MKDFNLFGFRTCIYTPLVGNSRLAHYISFENPENEMSITKYSPTLPTTERLSELKDYATSNLGLHYILSLFFFIFLLYFNKSLRHIFCS